MDPAWSAGGAPGGYCAVQASDDGGTTVFYAQTTCLGVFEESPPAQLWRFEGTNPAGTWARVDNNDGVDRRIRHIRGRSKRRGSPVRLEHCRAEGRPDGVLHGRRDTWDVDAELNDYMDGFGDFEMQTDSRAHQLHALQRLRAAEPGRLRPGRSRHHRGRWPRLRRVPVERLRSQLVAAHRSADIGHERGAAPAAALVRLLRPRTGRDFNVFVGTQGRGAWRIELTLPSPTPGAHIQMTRASTRSWTRAGTNPGGGPLTYEWDFDDDGVFDDAVGINPTFDLVGQDGVFDVAVKVTDENGAFDVDETTVTVDNVAPSI